MLIAPARPAATFGFAAQLFIADHRQYCPQLLVVGDSALVDLPNLVKSAIGEVDAVMTDRWPAIGMIDDGYPLANRRLSLVARFQDKGHLVVLQCQRLGKRALVLPGKRILQIVAGTQPPVQILLVRRRFGKASSGKVIQ